MPKIELPHLQLQSAANAIKEAVASLQVAATHLNLAASEMKQGAGTEEDEGE